MQKIIINSFGEDKTGIVSQITGFINSLGGNMHALQPKTCCSLIGGLLPNLASYGEIPVFL